VSEIERKNMEKLRTTIKPILILAGLVALGLIVYHVFRRQVQTAVLSDARGGAIDESASLLGDSEATSMERNYDIVTLLPPDAIPAIDNPRFYTANEADFEYEPEELVLGITIEGESKAYSTSYLDNHEIVNDTLGGRAIAVTW
jgi:hypothetical protein